MADPRIKMNADRVRELRRRFAAGEDAEALAVVFGVTAQTVKAIAKHESWASVDPLGPATPPVVRAPRKKT